MKQDRSAIVSSFLFWLHEREICQDEPAIVTQFQQAYHQLIHVVRQANPATLNHLLQQMVQGMSPEQSNWEFGSLANTCGMMVERGGDPTIAIAAILDRLAVQFAHVPAWVYGLQEHFGVEQAYQVAEQDWPRLAEKSPEHAWIIGEWHALRFTAGAAMTMLCRDIKTREQARQRIDLLLRAESARSHHPYAYYLAELLGMVDRERVLILDLSRQLGFYVQLIAVRNNFHFFTLLQDALLTHSTAIHWRGPPIRPVLVQVAKGERLLSDIAPNEWNAEVPAEADRLSDTALWTFSPWSALRPDGTLRTMNQNHNTQPDWIWGEMRPTVIPMLENTRILLLGPLESARSWDIAFFVPLHAALRSSVLIEEQLSREEYLSWIGKITKATK